MKEFILCVVCCTILLVYAVPSKNTFASVTNDWYCTSFSNVYELAQVRHARNTNDVVAAYLMLDWYMAFGTVKEITNQITRVIRLSDTITNADFARVHQSMRPACLSYRDDYLPSLKNEDINQERHKSYLPCRHMIDEYMLLLLDKAGLW